MFAQKFEAKLLMVDRSRFACLRIASLLADEPGISFHFATGPDDALELVQQIHPTVVLYTPDEDHPPGLIEALRGHRGGTTVLLLGESSLALPGPSGDLELDTQHLDIFADREQLLAQLASHCSPSAALAPALADGVAGVAASTPARSDSAARVLLIDDSRVVCRAFHEQLDAQANVVFESCLDSTRAQAVAERFRPTVILLDLEMPEVSGFELLGRFRAAARTASVPIIVLSGIADVSAKVRAFRLGASDYAEKKMERVELTHRIAYHSRAYRTAERLGDSIAELTAAKQQLELQGAFVRRTFGRYLSDEIVASILESPEGLELGGEKRVVTAMMTDLRGFTPLGEQLAPQDLLTLLNNYLRAMTDVLLAHAGTIDEFIGDAILAVFGAPLTRPDDAPRAVACAVAMQLAMAEVNDWNRQHGYPDLAMGIGINTGEVIVGNIGSERRAKYGIVGANVNLTARIESYTRGGQILVSEQTVRACAGALQIEAEREVLPKGFAKPITIYEVGGIGGKYRLYLPNQRAQEVPELEMPADSDGGSS